jgi:hypothetical protein
LGGRDIKSLRRDARKQNPDSPLWVDLDHPHPSHPVGIVYVQNFVRGNGEGHPAASMVRDAVDTAVVNLQRLAGERPESASGSPERFLIALIGFRMGAGGDASDRIESAKCQVKAAYDAIDRHRNIDIAFVLDDRAKHEIFLLARRLVLKELARERPTVPLSNHPGLVQALRNGECVVFVGAGLSANSGMTGYRELIKKMADELEMGDDIEADQEAYLDLAQMYREEKEPAAVVELVKSLFGRASDARPSLAHYLLMGLPVRFVITTNYDHLLEQCLEALHRSPVRVIDREDVAETGYRDRTYVVKFHGDAERGDIILSRNDYDSFFQNRPDMASLLEGLLLNQTFFFIGYSLRDPDFRQIYGKIGAMLRNARQPAYVVTFEAAKPKLREHLAKRKLHLLELTNDAHTLPEGTTTEKGRRLLTFLDQLSEDVSEGTQLFLASENRSAPTDSESRTSFPALRPLQDALNETGCRAIDAILSSDLRRDQVPVLSRVLSHLAEMGWRPDNVAGSADTGAVRRGPVKMHQLWIGLANVVPIEDADGRQERRQLLLTGLRFADQNRNARYLQKLLHDLDDCEKTNH